MNGHYKASLFPVTLLQYIKNLTECKWGQTLKLENNNKIFFKNMLYLISNTVTVRCQCHNNSHRLPCSSDRIVTLEYLWTFTHSHFDNQTIVNLVTQVNVTSLVSFYSSFLSISPILFCYSKHNDLI